MKYILHKNLIAILLFIFSTIPLMGQKFEISAAAVARISISSTIQIDGEYILLGKIAKIESDDSILKKRLSGVNFGRSPLPGRAREIEAAEFRRCLKKNQLDPARLVLNIPPRFIVKRSQIEISRDKIKQLVSEYVSKNLINNLDDARIKRIGVSEGLILPGGSIVYTVTPTRNRTRLGKIPLAVNFAIDGKFYKRIWATATVEVFANVVVTKKPLGRHKPITEDDIEIEKRDMAKLPANVITDPEVVLGQRTRRAIGTKTVLRSNLVEFPPLVKRGDVVVIVAESANFKITALGQVKRKGRVGDRIPVINFDSKKVIYARVVDSNTVQVEFK